MKKAVFPLDKRLGLNQTAYSLELAKKMVWLSGLLAYQQCADVFEQLTEQIIPASSIWRQTQYHGERLQSYVQHQQEQCSVERTVLADARYDHNHRKMVAMDGGMVNIRGEGWREMKVGVVADVKISLERNPQTHELDEMAHGINLHYTAVLGSKEQFIPALWALAVKNNVPTARERCVVGDGALWVWSVAEDVCPDGRQIVDWFHAVQHIAHASLLLYPDDKDVQKRACWLKTHKEYLYTGRIHAIISALHQNNMAELATYFERHHRRMQYLEYREDGFPIGSGTVESGVKQFKQRLTGTGMRWNIANVQRILIIRSSVLSYDFDELWQLAS